MLDDPSFWFCTYLFLHSAIMVQCPQFLIPSLRFDFYHDLIYHQNNRLNMLYDPRLFTFHGAMLNQLCFRTLIWPAGNPRFEPRLCPWFRILHQAFNDRISRQHLYWIVMTVTEYLRTSWGHTCRSGELSQRSTTFLQRSTTVTRGIVGVGFL